jgi:hypothetical protein
MERLEALLDRAADALIAGNLPELALLAPQIESVAVQATDRMAAERLRAKAERNARLLDAAMRGLKAARHRVSEITRGPTLSTYDSRGQKAVIAPMSALPARRV